ncbi:PQQ-binding-like beta-propeller repeat protein [Halosolutus gelatinilyticus]|uniref:outer membrane protein assembly factor BamB family protein n=1 Tax=Halosolutus gelatinilyticus TaxID=2931975 RepID=UPI001FF2BD0C|nr:PQQ-binding-like beta-propeller repeat protein [Halosolutus gelatinilyticus]
MIEHGRRDVLKYTGLAVAGSVLATGAASADRADESTAEADGWSSLGGGPGNNPIVSPADDVGPAAEVAWEYEHVGPVAAVDGTVYLTTGGEVHALDGDDGSVEWTTHNIGASGTPTVTTEAVIVGGERLTAIDPDTGKICCQLDPGYDEAIPSPTVADGHAFTVADGVLYAVDLADREFAWEFDPDGDALYEQPVAAGNGAVFAASESTAFALKIADGSVRWADDEPAGDEEYSRFAPPNARQVSYPVATDDVVAIGSVDSDPYAMNPRGYTTLYDAETGEKLASSEREPFTPGPIAEERFYARDTFDVYGYDRETGERDWETPVNTYHVESAIVGDGTVYAGLSINGDTYGPDNMPEPEVGVYAIDEETGERKWAIGTDDPTEEPTLALADGTLYASATTLLAIRSADDGADEGDEGSESDETADDGSGDDGTDGERTNDSETDGSGGNETDDASDGGSDGDDGTANASEGENGEITASETRSETETKGEENDAVPGFTAGAGIAGGALTLGWLRRTRADNA